MRAASVTFVMVALGLLFVFPNGSGLGPEVKWVTDSAADWATGTVDDLDVSRSPGDLTLPQYVDEFEGADLGDLWTAELQGGSIDVAAGAVTLTGGEFFPHVISDEILPQSHSFRVVLRFQFLDLGAQPTGLGIGAGSQDAVARVWHEPSLGSLSLDLFDQSVLVPADAVSHTLQVDWNGDAYVLLLDGALRITHVSNVPVAPDQRRVWLGSQDMCCPFGDFGSLRVDSAKVEGLLGFYHSRIFDASTSPIPGVHNPGLAGLSLLGSVAWHAEVPADGRLIVTLIGSDDLENWSLPVALDNGEPPTGVWTYRYYQYRVALNAETTLPVMHDITLGFVPDLSSP